MHEINNILARRSNKIDEGKLKRQEPIDFGANSGIDPERVARLKNEQRGKAISGFEAMLVQEVFKSMWAGVEKSTLFGEDSNESQIYQDMMVQAVSDETAKGKGVGVKAYLQKELERLDQAKNHNQREVSNELVSSKVINAKK